MSNEDFGEMMMVSVPVAWARGVAQSDGQGWSPLIRENCKAALDARKSKYERWRGKVATDMSGQPGEMANYLTGDCGYKRDTAKLMAAALQGLEALLVADNHLGHCKISPAYFAVRQAIHAAVPSDVAAEILGESK